MITLGRQQIIALALAFALIAICVTIAAALVAGRTDALQDLESRQAQLSRLKAAHARPGPAAASSQASAPDAAFVDGATAAIAGAELQAHLARLVAARNAGLTSSAIVNAARGDSADAIRLQVSFDIGWPGLQSLLYELEAGLPYIFIDTLSLQPRVAGDPLLHVTLGLRTLWRRTVI